MMVHKPVTRRSFLTLLSTTGLVVGGAMILRPGGAYAQQVSILRPRIEAALRGITTQQGSFLQIDTNSGSGQAGQFWIQRPGKLRFEYQSRPELLVADGRHVARVNTRTGSVSRVRINATPLRVILSDEVDLTDGVTITSMEQTPDSLFITFYETGKRDQGLLTIFLDVNTYELRGWKIDENDGNVTTVILQDTVSGTAIDQDAFVIPAG